ncbi:MAG TPA: hypothetical protein VJ841_03830 [Candidatus Saccharimonadales bacterium]|nr:hypothetical protein [Candidatus Saccharimonadales bacterium]
MININLSSPRTKITVIVIVAISIGVGSIFLLTQPRRSVEAFCQVIKEESSVLINDANAEARARAYRKLEASSPDDIRPDITAIRKGYEKMAADPSSTFGVGFGILGSENRRDDYLKKNCQEFQN